MRRWEARKQAQRQAEEEAKSGYKRQGGLGRSYQPLIDENDEESANELISFDSAEVQSAAQMATELRNITDKCEVTPDVPAARFGPQLAGRGTARGTDLGPPSP